jgi:SAM-dependent methyltransferase
VPSAIFNVYSAEEQWRRFWKNKSLARQVNLCKYRELRLHLAEVLGKMEDPLVVEAGCGIGAWVVCLSQCGVRRMVGVDNYAPGLRELKQYQPNSLVLEADVRKLPFGDNSIDVCISLGVVEHFMGGPGPLILEMFRVLRPGGYMFLTVPFYNAFRRLLIHPLRSCYMKFRSLVRSRELHFVEYRFRRLELEKITAACGFELTKVATDEYEPSELAIGLYTDLPSFRGAADSSLNALGRFVRKSTLRISPWLTTGGILIVARKPGDRESEAKPGTANGTDLQGQRSLPAHT